MNKHRVKVYVGLLVAAILVALMTSPAHDVTSRVLGVYTGGWFRDAAINTRIGSKVTATAETRLHWRSNIRSHRKFTIQQLSDMKSDDMTLNIMNDNFSYCRSIAPPVNPFQYVANSRAPCWWEGDALQCVPYFYIVGFSKSGTTDLYSRLVRHRQVLSTSKEKHWFDYGRFIHGLDRIENYTDMFRESCHVIQFDLKHGGKSERIFGDATPSTAWQAFYWRCYQGNEGRDAPRITNADIIFRLYPRAKIIFMLREPAERLYSRYLTWLYQIPDPAYNSQPSPASFHRLVTSAVEKYKECFKAWSPRHCVYNGTLYGQVKLRLQEGAYSVFVKDWLRVFPAGQILFLRFESYKLDVPNTLRQVLQFLELDIPEEQDWSLMVDDNALYTQNKGLNYNIGPMMAETRMALEEFYAPFNQELATLLQDKKFLWHHENDRNQFLVNS